MGSIPSEFTIDLFQTTDQRQHLVAPDRAARHLAKMGPAAERSRGIDQTLSRVGLKHGASSVRALRQGFSPGGPKRLGGEESFPAGQLGNFSGELKLAAFRSPQTVSLDRALGQLRINGTHLREEWLMAFHGELAWALRGKEPGARTWVGPTWL